MRILDRSILLFIVVYIISVNVLASIGERRPDVYISVFILVYFIYISLDPTVRENSNLKGLNIFLFIIFMLIVIYRVLTILGVKVI